VTGVWVKEKGMLIGTGKHTYNWIEDWAQIPHSESVQTGWAHPGMVINAAGEIVTFHGADPTVLIFDVDGNLLRTFDTTLTEGHGLAISREGDDEFLWVADTGSKRRPESGYQYGTGLTQGRVVKISIHGQVVLTIQHPDLEVYRGGRFSPTMVTIHEERFGGDGDIWVADGYGQNQVHHFNRWGRYLGSIDGSEGSAGSFTCPHSIWLDTRKHEPELYVADRSNHRIQVYDLAGHFQRAFGAEFLISPTAFAQTGDFLIVAELHARLTVIDREDRFVCYLGRNDEVCQLDGWPNTKNAEGVPTRTNQLGVGKFNSPHSLSADSRGNIYVSEWLIGGRTVKLVKV
jgi:hypothetical protein